MAIKETLNENEGCTFCDFRDRVNTPILGDNEDVEIPHNNCCSFYNFYRLRKRILIFFGILVIVGLVISDVILWGNISAFMDATLEFVDENGVLGVLVFVLVFTVSTIVLFPPVILTYGAGFTFSACYGVLGGTAIGTLAVLVGATIGSLLSFLLGRYVIRDAVSRWVSKFKILKAIDLAVQYQGFKVSALLRLSPLIPFGVLNYIFSVTRITLRDFALGTVGIIPGTIAFVFIGAISGAAVTDETSSQDDDDEAASTTKLILYVLGGVATLVAFIFITRHTKKILRETLEDAFRESQLILGAEDENLCDVCKRYRARQLSGDSGYMTDDSTPKASEIAQ